MFQLPNHGTQRKFADADSYMMGNSANSALGMRPYFYKFFIIAILLRLLLKKQSYSQIASIELVSLELVI